MHELMLDISVLGYLIYGVNLGLVYSCSYVITSGDYLQESQTKNRLYFFRGSWDARSDIVRDNRKILFKSQQVEKSIRVEEI